MARARFRSSASSPITDPDSFKHLVLGAEVLSCALHAARSSVAAGVTPVELSRVVERSILESGANPILQGLVVEGVAPFPAAASVCVNEVAVNGVPRDEALRDGDVITIDAACEYKGLVTDGAISVAVGIDDHPLVRAAQGVLAAVLGVVRPGAPLAELAAEAQRAARTLGVDLADEAIAHGVGRGLHEPPAVFLDGVEPDPNGRIEVGMVLAIEPVVVETSGSGGAVVSCRTGGDGWSRIAPGRAVFEERTILVTENGARELTDFSSLGFPAA